MGTAYRKTAPVGCPLFPALVFRALADECRHVEVVTIDAIHAVANSIQRDSLSYWSGRASSHRNGWNGNRSWRSNAYRLRYFFLERMPIVGRMLSNCNRRRTILRHNLWRGGVVRYGTSARDRRRSRTHRAVAVHQMFVFEAGRNDRDLHVILHLLVEHGPEDDVGIFMCRVLDDGRRFVHLSQLQRA